MTMAQTANFEREHDELEHYGIKGMKWGVRKNRDSGPESSSAPAKPKPTMSADAKRVSKIKSKVKTKGRDSLSNDEMQDLVKRMNLEQQYSNLNPSKAKKGMDYLKTTAGVLGTVGSIYAFSKSPLAQDFRKVFTM